MSGAKLDRLELNMLKAQLRAGDIVVIDKLDRLGRSIKDLIEIISDFEFNGVSFISQKGKLIFHIFASLAEFEATHPLRGSLHQRSPDLWFAKQTSFRSFKRILIQD